MLSDRDREALVDLERGIAADDPAFVRAFDAASQRGRTQPGQRLRTAALVLTILLTALMLLLGQWASAVGLVVTGVVLTAFETHCQARRREPPPASGTPGLGADDPIS